MNVNNRVFSRLFQEDVKVELKSTKIELSVVDDIDKLNSKATSSMLEAASLAQKAIKEYDNAAQTYAEAQGLADNSIPKAQDLGAKSLVKELKGKSSNIGKDLKRANTTSSKIKSLI